MHDAWRIYGLLGKDRLWVVASLCVTLLASAAGVVTVAITAAGVGSLATARTLDGIAPLALALAALIVARTLLSYLQGLVAQATAAVVTESARLGPGFLVRRSSGDVLATAVDGVESIQVLVSRFLPQVVVSTVVPLAIFAYLLTISAPVAIAILACAPLSVFARRLMSRPMRGRSNELWGERGRISALFVDSLQGLPVIKSFNRGPAQADLIEQRARDYRRAIMALLKVMLVHAALTELSIGVGIVLALWLGSSAVLAGTLTVSQLVVIYVLARELYLPISRLNVVYHDADVALAAGGRIFSLLDAEPAVADVAPAPPAGPLVPSIRFEDVTFAYERGDAPALVDLTFAVEPGQTVAIVGPSGAGKSTVVNLLLRFWDPQQGRILVGGHDVRDYPLRDLRALLAVVAQDTYLFNTTVLENIRLGRADATDEEVRAAARAASAEEFILALPDGYQTVIGERGARLSGGERQRLAIARAFLKNAPILLLDEATSSLDSTNERAVQDALAGLMQGRTTLIIAHRLSTVAGADRILVLDGGRLVEAGAHAELLGQQRVYSGLVAAQRKGGAWE
jgi:ABC-type multidrug transport system fused ATPase/permease subunit